MTIPDAALSLLRCPRDGSALDPVAIDEARQRWRLPGPEGVESVVAPSHGRWAYPVVDGVPLLLWPEALLPPGESPAVRDAAYAEAYRDVSHYTAAAAIDAATIETVVADHNLAGSRAGAFPEPSSDWLAGSEGLFDLVAEREAYRFLAPVEGRRALQVGGKGVHAVKLLTAGAAEGWLLTPVLQEARFARALAARCGVTDRLHTVVGVGEEPPFAPGTFDCVYSPGSLHHTDVDRALPALAAILAPGGRLACVDPWRAPGYALGTRILGKRERDVGCRPLTWDRLGTARDALPGLEVALHGALTRYPLIALAKARLPLGRDLVLRVMGADDALARRVPPLARLGSGACLTYRRPEGD